jgi:predicted permease
VDPGEHSYPEYLDYATESRTMQSISAIKFERFNMTLADGSSYHLRGQLVTRNYFRTIGVPLAMGREFTVDEARGAAPLPVIITDAVWQTQFHRASDVLGQSVLLNGLPATIVGVAPPHFHGASFAPNLEICVPIVPYSRLRGTESQLTDPTVNGVGILGRLAPGASLAAAQRELGPISNALLAPYTATAFGPNSGPQARLFMTILMAVALLTLLVVCANVANLLLARSVARQREIGLRLALGAPFSRILRTLLAEGMVLSLAATAAALAFAMWATRAVIALIGFDVDLTPDWRVGAYALLLAVVCTLAFSVAPAWRVWRQDLLTWKRRSKMAGVLMVAQFALCVVLLTAGGLAWRSLSLIDGTDLGFPRDRLLLANVGGADGADLERVRQNLLAVPGVESASWAVAAPPHSHPWMGLAAQASTLSVPTDGTRMGPDYLHTLGVPILEGVEGAVVINRKLAQALWPGQSAVGRTFLLGTNIAPLQVAGVVPDAAFNGVGEDGSFSGLAKSERRPFIFIADARKISANEDRTFHIRYRSPLADLVPAVRAAIHRTDPRLTVFSVRTMQTEWEEFTSPVRVVVTLVACFAIGGLFVASVGLYAVVAFYTGKRTRELGIRAALGATPAQVARVIVKEGLRLTGLGLAAGLAICGVAGRAFGHLLFGVTPTDAATWLAVVALLTAVSLTACWLPARRAARVDPMLALRQD